MTNDNGGSGVLAGISILVLEDDRDTMDLVAGSLRKLGGAIRTATTAAAALAALSEVRPDVILCDLHLPDTDGYAFLAMLRADGAHQMIPVIAISASHPIIERNRALEAGFTDYLVKPSRIAETVAVITRLAKPRA